MTELIHKGYTATIAADPETGLLRGEAMNARALLTFAGCSMDEVKTAFEATIAGYEEWCRERDRTPETPRRRIAVRKTHRGRLTPAKIYVRFYRPWPQPGSGLDRFGFCSRKTFKRASEGSRVVRS